MPEEIKKDDEKKEDEVVKEEEGKEKEKIDTITMDDLLEDEGMPKDVEKVLETEMKSANEQAKIEVEAMEKGEEILEKKPENEKKSQKEEKKEEKTEDDSISDDLRKRYEIPEHIKTLKALADWGKNAEKHMNKVQSERDKISSLSAENEKRLARLEAVLSNLDKAKVEDNKMSEEERLIRSERLRNLRETDELAYAEELKREWREEAVAEAKRKEDENNKKFFDKNKSELEFQQDNELKELAKKYGTTIDIVPIGDGKKRIEVIHRDPNSNWETEVFPAIQNIVNRKPNALMQSFKEIEKIYLYEKMEAEQARRAEDEAKRKEKQSLGSEASHRAAEDTTTADEKLAATLESLPDDISIAELNKIAGLR